MFQKKLLNLFCSGIYNRIMRLVPHVSNFADYQYGIFRLYSNENP